MMQKPISADEVGRAAASPAATPIRITIVTLDSHMMASAIVFGWLLVEFSALTLIRVIQSAAVVTLIINGIALWKQEPRNAELTRADRAVPTFREAFTGYCKDGRTVRLLVAVALGAAGFAMGRGRAVFGRCRHAAARADRGADARDAALV